MPNRYSGQEIGVRLKFKRLLRRDLNPDVRDGWRISGIARNHPGHPDSKEERRRDFDIESGCSGYLKDIQDKPGIILAIRSHPGHPGSKEGRIGAGLLIRIKMFRMFEGYPG